MTNEELLQLIEEATRDARTTFDLSDNQLTNLPPEITQFSNLTELNLWDNTELNLWDNPVESLPLEVVRQGIEAVRAYFSEIKAEATTHLYEAKLLIVGQGEVGKTCLMHRLIHNNVPETVTTEGIDISQWNIATQQTGNFRINVWDFGGQEIYHATHQFFLTKRSLYLFVWEARADTDVFFDYWLNTINILSDNSPVIVVQNKVDQRHKSINQEGLKKRFPNIVGFFDISALTGEGCDALHNAIIREIEQLPHIGNVLPQRWMDVRQRLEDLNENFITYSDYQSYCADIEMDETQAILKTVINFHFERSEI